MGDPVALPVRATRRRRFLRASLVLGASSLFAFLVGELVCRVKWGAATPERLPLMEVRAHPTRGFEMIPDSEHYTYLERVRVNHLGLRGADLSEEGEREVRVLALGDSLVYGQGVAEDSTIPAHLERILYERRGSSVKPCRVVNGGVRAYNTRQELALLEELGPRIHPDVVVLFWFANDLEDPDLDALRDDLVRSGPIVFDVRARLEGSVLWKWRAKQLLRRSALLMRLHDAWTNLNYKRSSATDLEAGFGRLEGYLARFAELGKAQGFDVLVCVIPVARLLDGSSVNTDPAPRVLELARRHALPAVDLRPPLATLFQRRGALPTLAYDGHYDGEANAAMAETVADLLLQHFGERFQAAR